jgi:DNA-binding NtrC family response regulator
MSITEAQANIDWTWRALVVDDDPLDVDLLRVHAAAMRGPYLLLDQCSDPDALLTILQETSDVDLVLLDYRLADRDGLDVLRSLRAAGILVPIVLLTGHADIDLAMQAMRAGANDFLAKQELAPMTLARTVRYVMAKHQAEQRLALTLQELGRSRDDMASMLDRLRLSIIMTNERGQVIYVNHATERLMHVDAASVLRAPWQKLCPAAPDMLARLESMLHTPVDEREMVALHFQLASGEPRWLDVEVHDDPRDVRRKILFCYDVSEVHDLRAELAERVPSSGLIGQSEPMQRVAQLLRDLAAVDSTALIVGETGTGKELAARAIHAASPRRDKPFVAINCAGLTESLLASQLFGHRRGAFTGALQDQKGLFVAAEGGTILLDEIGDIPPAVQTALLRVLQEREVTPLGETTPRRIDVRVLAATHQNLLELVEKGQFRRDLLYRIRVARVDLPPLRQRPSDIPVLVQHFLAQLQMRRSPGETAVLRVSRAAMMALCAHDWPGNVRELRSAVEFASIRCRRAVVQVEDLPPEVVEAQPHAVVADLQGDERSRIQQALQAANGNRTHAASLLGWSRATFYRRMAEIGLPAPPRRRI